MFLLRFFLMIPSNEQKTLIWHKIVINNGAFNLFMLNYVYTCIISPKISRNNQYLYFLEVENTFGQGEFREPFGSKHLTMAI